MVADLTTVSRTVFEVSVLIYIMETAGYSSMMMFVSTQRRLC